MSSASPAFTISDLQIIDSMNEQELDALPHGAIQLDSTGRVLRFNAYEERLAGITKQDAIGKSFFREVAPCTNMKEFYGRFRDGVAAGQLHCKFRYHFAFKQNPRDVMVTLFYYGRDKTVWVFVRPLDGSGLKTSDPKIPA
jgi:photoactive yellow protein